MTAIRTDLSSFHPRLRALSLAAGVVPPGNARTRTRLLLLAGVRIGEGTLLHGIPRLSGSGRFFERLEIGRDCAIGEDCAFDLEHAITIGDRVSIGPGAMILTSSHEVDAPGEHARAAVKSPVRVGAGALLGARSVILPGVTIGVGAIVNPGAVVNQDVPPHTCVGGIPAVQIEVLPGGAPGSGA